MGYNSIRTQVEGGSLGMLKTLAEFWKDDTGLDEHVSKLLYAVMGIVVGGLVIGTVGFALRKQSVELGKDFDAFKATTNKTLDTTSVGDTETTPGTTTLGGIKFN
jgi:hypothetical protein